MLKQMGGRVEAEGSLETWCRSTCLYLLPVAILLPCQKIRDLYLSWV